MGDHAASVLTLRDIFSYRNLVHAVAGAAGSSVAITVFYPLDVARTRLQVEDGRKSKLSPFVVKDIWDEEGLVGIYRGWWPVVTSVCCSNFVYFYVFSGLKYFAYRGGAKPYPTKDLSLAFVAGLVNVMTTTPMWVANTRLRLQGIRWKASRSSTHEASTIPNTNYKGLIDALFQIFEKEGIAGLWSGALPSAVLASNPAVQFMVYEALKRKFQKMYQQQLILGRIMQLQFAKTFNAIITTELSSFMYFLMGALAKMAATFVTYPIQLIQSRLRAGQGKEGIWQCIENMIRSQGWASLYKGLEAKLTTTIAMAALMFLTYEKIAAVVFSIMRQQRAKSA